MTTLATHNPQASTTGDTLFVAFELSEKTQIPSDLVVKYQAIDIIDVMRSLNW